MKVLQINTVYPNGSTGKIVQGIYEQCKNENIECRVAYRYFKNNTFEDAVAISSWLDCHIHNRLVKWTNLQGCFSHYKTKKFIKWIDSYNPDIIHLHNIHGSYLNFKLLFEYIKKRHIIVNDKSNLTMT